MNRNLRIASLAVCVLLLSVFPVCGGAATAYIVSGMVTAPGGIIASSDKTDGASLASVLDFFIPSAEAKLAGLLPVPNGTSAELVRISDTGRMSAPIATATIKYGRYRFDLSALRLTVSSRLLVRVDNVATGEQLRAFVTDKTVNINPVSETAVRLVLDTIASTQNGTLDNFTVTELEDLYGSLDLLTSVNTLRTDTDIESSVLAVRNAAADNRGVVNFLAACALPGQTSAGPGDIGNFFPFTRGISWTYTVRKTEDGIASAPYTDTVTVRGTQLVKGIATTVFRNSNPEGDGKADNDYVRKTSIGVFDWELVKDGDMNNPYRTVRFPAAPGSSFRQTLGDMGLNRDLDRDGIVERFNFTVTTTVLGLETVRVPAGTLRNSLKIRTVAIGTAIVSSTRKKITVTATDVEWYTKNLGMAKQVLIYNLSYGGRVSKDTYTLELTEADGFPFTGEFPLDQWTSLDVESNDIVYDPISGKLFASVPSGASNYADSIAVIDPVSAQVETTIPVGANPGPLAVSDDGQYLYVGLNGIEGSVLQIALPTLTKGPEWPLSKLPGDTTTRYPTDIAVQPGSPEVIAVSTGYVYTPYWSPDYYTGTVILDAGTERPTSITELWNGASILAFSDDPSVAYGYNWSHALKILSVTDNGVSVAGESDFYSAGFVGFKYGAGRVFTHSGVVLDPATWTTLGVFSSDHTGNKLIEPNAQTRKTALLTVDYPKDFLEIFDLDTHVKLSEKSFPAQRSDGPTELRSLGRDMYVIRVVDTSTSQERAHLILVRLASGS